MQCILIPVYGDKVVVHQEVELLREFSFGFKISDTVIHFVEELKHGLS